MRSRRSLLQRLLLWQSITIVFTLSVLTLALFLIVTSRLRQHHDEDLKRACGEAVEILRGRTQLDDLEEVDQALRELGHDVNIRPLLPEDPPLRGAMEEGVIALSNRAARRLDGGEAGAPHGHEPSGTLRIASCLFHAQDGSAFLVEATENLGDLDSTLQSLELVILTVAPMVLLLALGVGAVVIVRALRPLRSVVRWASSLDAERLGARIPVTDGPAEAMVLVDAFNQMTSRLAASFRQVQEFAANASHELRTPLTSLTSSFEVVLQKPRDAREYREALERSLPEVRRLNRIVENLLVMAQADSGDVKLRTVPVELDAILLESYEALHLGKPASEVTIELGEVEVGTIEADPHWLRQLFDNLIGNAMKYSLPGGVVRIYATGDEDEVRVAIEDEGVGIPEEERERIFSRYYRVQSERGSKVTGVGLGLAIAKWAAEAHGGRIQVEGSVPSGTRFTVVLPRRQSTRRDASSAPARTAAALPGG